jgi:hypothetical protein
LTLLSPAGRKSGNVISTMSALGRYSDTPPFSDD